jgi:hydroxymethylbilane synthase
MKSIVIGTRGSKLALAQSNGIADRIRNLFPRCLVEIKIIKTTGDKMATASLAKLANETKGLFVKEIEDALLDQTIDLAVHSLKDVPTELPEGLEIGIIPERENPRDALVSHNSLTSFEEIPSGAKIGTSSLRRVVQLKSLRPDLETIPIRGNVDTRIRKINELGLFGIILAVSGLKRMSLERHIAYTFRVEEMVPAIGQGALAIETRKKDQILTFLKERIEDKFAAKATAAERLFLQLMGGGCQIPMGAYAEVDHKNARFLAVLASPSGEKVLRSDLQGNTSDLEELVRETARIFISKDGKEILKEVESL